MGLHASIGASPSPYSPTASIALERASETLAGLGRQLTELNMAESDPDVGARCCCNGHDCAASGARGRLDAKLKLCGGKCISNSRALTTQRLEQLCSNAAKR